MKYIIIGRIGYAVSIWETVHGKSSMCSTQIQSMLNCRSVDLYGDGKLPFHCDKYESLTRSM